MMGGLPVAKTRSLRRQSEEAEEDSMDAWLGWMLQARVRQEENPSEVGDGQPQAETTPQESISGMPPKQMHELP